MNEARFTELEIKLAYQEDLLQALNKTVVQQQQQIKRLENTCQLLYERVNNIQTEKRDTSVEPPPPHY